jgi:outer membrane receptor protein involved in Fe transport
MLFALLLAVALDTAPPPRVVIVDSSGAPIPNVTVTVLRRESDGTQRVSVSAPGFVTRIAVVRDGERIVLARRFPIISSVRVATGSAQSLHALPVAVSVLDRAAIASSTAYTSDALLRNLAGFDRTRSNSMFTNYGQLRLSFAGAGNDRGLMLADGIPAQDGFGGQVDWAAYPPSDIQRAELLMGAGSALYGAGAVGGVLDVQTFSPPSSAQALPAGSLAFVAGSHAYTQQYANVSSPITQRLGTAVSLQQERLQYFALAPGYSSPIDTISQSDASMVALNLNYAMGERDTIALGERSAWDDQFEGRPNYTFWRRLAQTDLRYIHSTSQSVLQTAMYSRIAFVFNAADQFPTKPGVLRYIQNVPTNESGVSVTWIEGSAPSEFQLRADVRQVHGESDQFGSGAVLQSSGSGSQTLGGFAAQETWRSGRLEVVGGARLDTVRSYDEQLVNVSKGRPAFTTPPQRTDSAISPRAGIRYDLSPNLTLRASSGTGLRAPFLNELVRGYFIGNVAYEPNPLLVPERSRTNSAGLDFANTGGRLSIDAFDAVVHDAIMFRTIDATNQVRSDVSRTQTDGYTVTYMHSIGSCSRLAAWYTDQYARVTGGPGAIVGKRLQYVPQNSASLDYTTGIGVTQAGVTVSYLGQTYADDLNAEPLGTAALLGAHASVPLASGATLNLTADNLTDARYLSSIDRYGPPAIISVGVALPIGPAPRRSLGCSS